MSSTMSPNRQTRKRASLPTWVKPQLAGLVKQAPDGPDWLHEIKLDGYRMHARLDAGQVNILTRRGNDWTDKYLPNRCRSRRQALCAECLSIGMQKGPRIGVQKGPVAGRRWGCPGSEQEGPARVAKCPHERRSGARGRCLFAHLGNPRGWGSGGGGG